jgi:hypothetical protein
LGPVVIIPLPQKLTRREANNSEEYREFHHDL